MTDYTATAYGVGGANKYSDRTTDALGKNIVGTTDADSIRGRDPNKGQRCMRFVIAAEDEIQGGEIWVNIDTTVSAGETFIITATATETRQDTV